MKSVLHVLAAMFCLFLVGVAAAQQSPPLQRAAAEQDPAALAVGSILPDLALAPLTGPRTSLAELLAGRKGAVLLMTSAGCPVSRKYAPRAAALEKDFALRGIAFAFINAVEAETAAEMSAHARESGFRGPYVADRDKTVIRALRARTTSEAFLIGPDRAILYRGAIDDQYTVGGARSAPRRAFLSDALAALLAGKPIETAATWAPGCLIDLDDASPAAAPAGSPTYFGAVRDILRANCVSCHRTGGVAPFSLETPGLLQGRARMIEAVIRDHLMPPSHGVEPAAGSPAFSHPRALAPDDRQTLLAWLRAGRPLGQPAAEAPLPPIPPSWSIGPPDLLLSTPGLDLAADGPMQHGRLMVPTGLLADRSVSAVEFRAQPPGSVHHALVWLLPPGSPLPAPATMPPAPEFLGAFSLADNLITFPPGVVRRLPAGALLIVDLYALPMGERKFISLRMAFRDAPPAPPPAAVTSVVLAVSALEIPAGSPSVVATAETRLDRDLSLIALTPSMRSRGTRLRLLATLPDGAEHTMLDAPRFDWRWQVRYALQSPLRLPMGTRLTLTGEFDNSPGNPAALAHERPAILGSAPSDECLQVILETLVPPPQ